MIMFVCHCDRCLSDIDVIGDLNTVALIDENVWLLKNYVLDVLLMWPVGYGLPRRPHKVMLRKNVGMGYRHGLQSVLAEYCRERRLRYAEIQRQSWTAFTMDVQLKRGLTPCRCNLVLRHYGITQ